MARELTAALTAVAKEATGNSKKEGAKRRLLEDQIRIRRPGELKRFDKGIDLHFSHKSVPRKYKELLASVKEMLRADRGPIMT
jgi:hypothetical protein